LKISNFSEVKQKEIIGRYFNWDKNIASIYYSYFIMTYENKIDTWDFQWIYKCVENNFLCITPYVNLVSNIGIKSTRDGNYSPFINMIRKELVLNK